jgi:MFS family permease
MGLTGAIFGPAINAMIADLIETHKRAQAFGLLRVVQNLGIAIGPAIGGFIATRSYLVLFGVAAIAAVMYGLIVALRIQETRPQTIAVESSTKPRQENLGRVLADQTFMLFCGLYTVMTIVYSQMNTTLPVYLNKSFGVTEQWYGLLMSLNAAMVVVFQFPITRFTDRFTRTAMMALGGAFFALGFGMFGFVGVLPLFFLAQAIWTVGEMFTTPVSQAFAADMAPETMRGRYMGVFGLVWTVAYGVGPLVGGAVMDRLDGRYIWYAAFALNGLAALGFWALGRRVERPTVPAAVESPTSSQLA